MLYVYIVLASLVMSTMKDSEKSGINGIKRKVKDMAEKEQELKMTEMSELERENQRLREENQRLKEYRASLPPKERLYDRIPLTVKQLDMIIAGLVILFLVVCVMGMMHH